MRRRALGTVLALGMLAVPACASGDTESGSRRPSDPPSTVRSPVTDASDPKGEACDDAPVPAPRAPGFERPSSELEATGDPQHALTDAVSVDAGPAPIAGRFQYGRLRRDLEEERIELWVDDCSPNARFAGEATSDDDGVVESEVSDLGLDPGRYTVHAVVAGDGTFASSTLTVVPAGTETTVFDIDGTLTISDRQFAGELVAEFFQDLTDDYVPKARSGAVEATGLHADGGRLVVYLTGRPVWLAELTRGWLDDTGMASGVLRMPAHDADAVPTEEGVGDAKRAELQALEAAGLRVLDAYGNATTDVSAYLDFGLPGARVHILGPHATADVDALGEDFDRHNEELRAEGLN